MLNYVQDGKRIQVTAPYDVASGAGCLVGAFLFGAALDAATSGDDDLILQTEGIVTLAKENPLVISVGDAVYWDDTAKEVDKTATNVLVGVCTKAAGSTDTTVEVKLFGIGIPDA